ncbi:hypothetical protein G9A89_007294 [Geosiphon pyriformis]|nr:hypothetical protein G9A89_007294 [Geosiphon pyriformis]
MNNTGSDDIIHWHKKKNNLVSIFTESKLKEKVFISGLESGYLGVGVVVVMNSSLVTHVYKISEVSGWLLSIKLLFKNNLSVLILGLYTGVSLVVQFSQTGDINSLIVKAVNESFFIILRDDFNKDGFHKCASFKKYLNFGLVNALGGSFCGKLLTWFNSRGIVRTINYVLISLNLVNAMIDRNVFGAVSVLVGLSGLLNDHWKYNCKGADDIKWAKFKDDTVANTAMLHDNFFVARMHSDLDAIWVALHKVLCLSAEAVFRKKWFKDYDYIFVEKSFKFYKLELLVSKLVKTSYLDSFGDFMSLLDKWKSLDSVNASVLVLSKVRKSYRFSKMSEAERIREFRIRSAIDKRMKSFELDKSHTIRNVLERFFYKVTLDYLVMDNKLVLKPDLVRTKINHNVVFIVPGIWCHQYQSLEYIFNDTFSNVMCSIDFNEMSGVISNLSNRKVAGFSGILNELEKHYNRSVLDILLVLLNFCLDCESEDVLMNTHPIVLIETARKIFSKIFSDRIFFVYSKFKVLRGDNFFVLKDITTQSSIFAIGLIIENVLEKDSYNSVSWEHFRKSLVRIKMCDKFIQFFGSIHNGWVNRFMTDFGLTDGYQVFSPLLWCIFYDPLLCEVKKQKSVYGYRLDSRFMTRTDHSEFWAGLTSFFVANAFVDNTIWVGSSQAAIQHILNVISEFFWINDISINNNKTVAILINCRVSEPCLLISGLPILIAKREKSYQYLGIFLSTESLLRSSLAKTHLDVQFFTNLMLRKTVSNKQFSYLVLAVLYSIVAYRTQFSFVSINVQYEAISEIITHCLAMWSNIRKLEHIAQQCEHCSRNHSTSLGNDIALIKDPEIRVEHLIEVSLPGETPAIMLKKKLTKLPFWEATNKTITTESLSIIQRTPQQNLQITHLQILSLTTALSTKLQSFEQIQAEDKSASIVGFANSVGILGHFRTPMSVILGKPTFYKCVFLLQHYGIAFIEQFCSHTGSVFEWKTFKWWKRLDSWGLVSYWFDVSVYYLNDSGPPFVCNLLLLQVGLSNVFKSYGFLSGLGTLGMKVGAAVFFEDINLGLGVEVFGLVSFTITELQAIALAFKCVSSSYSVDLFSDNQAALDAYKSESMLIHLDFRNQYWIKHHHIADVIRYKNLNINWVKVKDHSGVLGNKHADVFAGAATFSNMHFPHMINERFLRTGSTAVFIGSGSQVLVDSLHDNVDWSKSFLVWHPNFHLTAGFTSA